MAVLSSVGYSQGDKNSFYPAMYRLIANGANERGDLLVYLHLKVSLEPYPTSHEYSQHGNEQ